MTINGDCSCCAIPANSRSSASVLDCDEGGDDSRRRAVVRFGPDDGAGKRGHLIDATWPFGRRRGLVVVFPAVSLGAGAAGTDHDDADVSRWVGLHRAIEIQ